jgi:glycosyltransferase involved in cell wall biosynthesis
VKTAIVVPAFNEAASIATVVTAIGAYGTPIVVDDASTDDTGARAASAGAIIVRHGTNLGYDEALASGFAKAVEIGASSIVTIDADGQLDPAVLQTIIEKLKRAKLVLGVRSSGAARFSEALFNYYARLRFGVPDILCGLKGFHTQSYHRYRSRMKESSVHTAVALALLRDRTPFELVPVAVKPRLGASRYGSFWTANCRIIRALLRALWHDVVGS